MIIFCIFHGICTFQPTSRPEVTTTTTTTVPSIGNTDPIHSQIVDHSIHSNMANISHKLDTLINNTLFGPVMVPIESHNNHWIAVALVSIAINLILIAVFIYRKRKV
jgi:hypothetical protein